MYRFYEKTLIFQELCAIVHTQQMKGLQIMEYITTKEASQKWNISTSRITLLANQGRIPGAYRLGKSWLIPANATKPEPQKASRPGSAKVEPKSFSFPLYHFRPDWNSIDQSKFSEQQQILLQIENTILECRYENAYSLLESVLEDSGNVITEIACLWYKALCCIALNKPNDFSKTFFRLQFLLSEDFPNRDDMLVILDALKTYIETVGSSADNESFNVNINYQCLPLACVVVGYSNLTREVMKSGMADINLLEINLQFLQTTSATIAVEMMHCYLLGIYHLRFDNSSAERHAKAAVKIAYENKMYFPIVTYYPYFSQVFSPIIAQYPPEFQKICNELITEYEKNFNSFFTSIYKDTVLSKLTDADYPYIFAVLNDLSNVETADKLGVHPHTVKNKYSRLCEKFDVTTKKELREYLHNYL